MAIGRLVASERGLFLFDEAGPNLDAAFPVRTRMEIARLHGKLAATMIHRTHDQTEATTMADRIVVPHRGGIEQVSRPSGLAVGPDTTFVPGFTGSPCLTLLPARAIGTVGQGQAPAAVPRRALPRAGGVVAISQRGADGVLSGVVEARL